jgi:DNA-binding NarL/FixJ family response regulator
MIASYAAPALAGIGISNGLRLMTGNSASTVVSVLDPHEVATMMLVREGLPNCQIAVRLGVTEGDSMRTIIRIYKKLNVTTRKEAVAAWQQLRAEVPGNAT